MVLILYQVFQVTLWLVADKVLIMVSFWCKRLTTFHFTVGISFIVPLTLYQVFHVTLWLRSFETRVNQGDIWASFSVSWEKFHSTLKSVQIVQRLIWFKTYLILVLILAKAQSYTCFRIWLHQESKHLFTLRCILSFRQQKTKKEIGKHKRKIEKKKNANKKRK